MKLRARCVSALVTAAAALLVAGAPTSLHAQVLPAVARPHYEVEERQQAAGTVFFLKAPTEAGAVAVGAAHSFNLADLVRAGTVRFLLGHSLRPVSASMRFLVPPGLSFRDPDGDLAHDFVVFALDLKPSGVEVLEADPRGHPEAGERVRILGVPAGMAADDDDIFGTVELATGERVEVDLDVPADLRGWGGGPLVSVETGRVVGLLEGALAHEETLRIFAAPIAAVARAIQSPLDGGAGRTFASFTAEGEALARRASAGAPPEGAGGAAGDTDSGQPQEPRETAGEEREASGDAAAAREPDAGAEDGETTVASATPQGREASWPEPQRDPLLGAPQSKLPDLHLEVEYPSDGAVIGDRLGAFIAGRAMASLGELRKIDVVFVIDTSGSTREPTGTDVNGNGVVGEHRMGGVGGLFGVESTDPGDSILAAEVTSARRFLEGLDPRSTRVGLATFSGERSGSGGGFFSSGPPAAAITEVPLTRDYGEIERALDHVLERGPDGLTHMAAGVDQATIELLGLSGGLSEPDDDSEKFALFLTDGEPTLPYQGFSADNVRAVMRAAKRAARAGITVHSFAIGRDALEGPVAAIEIAERTGGVFTPVRHPGDLMDVIDEVRFLDLQRVEVHNRTTGASAEHVGVSADGSWDALLPLETGVNRVEVVAHANDGMTISEQLTLHYAPGADDPYLPRTLVAKRNRLLEKRLLELKRERLAAEQQQAEETRRELLLEIEEEREKAQDRAAEQRKELDLEIEERAQDPSPANEAAQLGGDRGSEGR